MLTSTVKVIGADIVKAKLIAATPAILAQNRILVKVILEASKSEIVGKTPLGPAHFGYHGRDTVRSTIISKGKRTVGRIIAATQLLWREKGTKRGEKALWVARAAVNSAKRYISSEYGGGASWWHL